MCACKASWKLDRHQSPEVGDWAVFRWFYMIHDSVFIIFVCKPVDVVKGIFLRASCVDGGVSNVRVGCDWFSCKSVNIFNANNLYLFLLVEFTRYQSGSFP